MNLRALAVFAVVGDGSRVESRSQGRRIGPVERRQGVGLILNHFPADRRSLLLRLEHPYRSALENHVHRTARLGARVL